MEFAFEYAQENGRKKVSAVHKANIMKATDGLYLHDRRASGEGTPDYRRSRTSL